MANCPRRTAARRLANFITTSPDAANTTRPLMQYFVVDNFTYGGPLYPNIRIQWVLADNSGGFIDIYKATYPGYNGSGYEDAQLFNDAMEIGNGNAYVFADGNNYDPYFGVLGVDIHDDGSSDYNECGPTSGEETSDGAPSTPIITPAVDDVPGCRIRLVLPDYIDVDGEDYSYFKEAVERFFCRLEKTIDHLPLSIYEGQLIYQKCLERRLFPGGWENTEELQEYLKKWIYVLSFRGSEVGIVDEVNRLHHAGDAAVTYSEQNWYLDDNFPNDGPLDTSAGTDIALFLDGFYTMTINVTQNNAALMPYDRARQIIKTYLIPVGFDLELLQTDGGATGFGEGGFGTGGFGS